MENLLQKLMLGGSTAALFAISGGAAMAQDEIEQVVVSASRITIAGYTQPTPVTVVGAAQLEKNAFSNIADAVRELPQVNSPPASVGINNGGAISGTEGAEILNLRSLGITRTLILFDGQRIAASNITGGVDINTIPGAVISRVDVVTGGASASWGSDAVAGVVNFIINKTFDGWKGNVSFGDTSDGKYRTFKAETVWGGDVLGGRGHLMLAGEYSLHPDLVTQDSKNWYRASYLVTNPAYVKGNGQTQMIVANDVGIISATQGGIILSSPAGSGATPSAANVLRGIEFVGQGIPQRVDYGNVTNNAISNGGSFTHDDGENNWTPIGIPNIRYTGFAYGSYKVSDTISASLQLNYGYYSGKDMAQNSLQTGAVIKSDNAYLPASVRAVMTAGGITSFTMGIINGNNAPTNVSDKDYFQVLSGSLGPAITSNQRQLLRGVFTLDGTIGDNWSWDAFYQHSTVRYWTHVWANTRSDFLALAQDAITVTTTNRGTSGLPLGAMACRSTLTAPTNGCIPLNVFGNGVASQEAIKYITFNNADFEHMQVNQDEAEGSIQGVLPWELPAGKVAVVFGGGYRQEAGVNFAEEHGTPAALWQIGNWAYFPPSHYYAMEGFAEITAPLLKNNIVESLDFSGAGRITDYSTSGMVETWKLGLSSQVDDNIRLRTTWSVDIRAPGLSDLFALGSQSNSSTKDPKTGLTQSVFTNTSGNKNLKPEVARTISGGVVLTPTFVDGLSISVDYYKIQLNGGIASISNSLILNTCTTAPNDMLCSKLIFDGPGGALGHISQSPVNIASEVASGFDIQANYTMPFWDGDLAWSFVGNYNDERSIISQPGQPSNNYAGVLGADQPAQSTGSPKWKGVISADYTTGPWSITPQVRWFGTGILSNQDNEGNLATAAARDRLPENVQHVPMWAYLDLRGSYQWNDEISFFGAIDNALNIPPALVPLASNNIIHSVPTSQSTYDLLGRQFRIGVRWNY